MSIETTGKFDFNSIPSEVKIKQVKVYRCPCCGAENELELPKENQEWKERYFFLEEKFFRHIAGLNDAVRKAFSNMFLFREQQFRNIMNNEFKKVNHELTRETFRKQKGLPE